MLPLLLLVLPADVAVIAASVKRLHDRNRSAWWLLLVAGFFVFGITDPFFEWTVHLRGNSAAIIPILLTPMLVLLMWGMIEVQFLRGTRGPNRFGPDPLQLESGAA